MASSRRDHLVATALDLFSTRGFHATGIDTVLAEAGVAKMTLYNHFTSKDELILAALGLHDTQFRSWFTQTVEHRAYRPRARLLAIFDALEDWFRLPQFAGCPFINACAEYAERSDPVHAAAAEHKRLVRAYLRGLAADAAAPDPDTLAHELEILMTGAIVTAQVQGEPNAAHRAKTAARALIGRALEPDHVEGAGTAVGFED